MTSPVRRHLLALPLGVLAFVIVPEPTVAATRDSEASTGGVRGVAKTFARIPLLPLVYGLYFAANALLYAIVVYYPQLLAGFGVSSSFVISLYLSAQGLAGGLSAYFYDRIRRRFDYRQITISALALWVVGFSIAAVASSVVLAFLPVVLFGIGQGLVFPTVLLWVEELVPAERQEQLSSYVTMAGYVGQFLFPSCSVWFPVHSEYKRNSPQWRASQRSRSPWSTQNTQLDNYINSVR